jgi:hypothetical protein
MRRNGNNGTAVPVPCGNCARPVGPVAVLGPDGTRYHPGCWEAAIVVADRISTLKAGSAGFYRSDRSDWSDQTPAPCGGL